MKVCDEIIDELSKEFNLPKSLIKKINQVQYKYYYDCLNDGSMEPVRILCLGSFKVSKYNKVARNAKGK